MMTTLFKPLIQRLSARQKLSIINYHQVVAEFDPMRPDEVTATQLTDQMAWISRCFNVLTLADAAEHLRNRTLPPRALVITFDDGYQNNATIALPILQHFNLNATFFIASDFLDGGIMWNDRVIEALRAAPSGSIDLKWLELGQPLLDSPESRQLTAHKILIAIKHKPIEERTEAVDRLCSTIAQPANLMLRSEQVQLLAKAGMEIGGHSCSHPILANLDSHNLIQEIQDNKLSLQKLIDEPVLSFAYPNGKPIKDYNQSTISALKEAGYRQAVTTCAGTSEPSTDLFQLPRFTPWRKQQFGFMAQLSKNYYTSATQLASQ
ncbi:polysaccharide deacetylase family protein [Motiliproteus coralliicola]|uniref:Polysaccharide deacetylase family protein n=1 Tax=Motiliproteus coralliicola TaxID=2283196 RepID=A0A369WW93_9GAMM|nr:polysaccharide deacetylase family protein [Motiliproteus coralliicola]RDE24816.1 polysaccharide deacetylase family protein [Motiliproteus coralliicola]